MEDREAQEGSCVPLHVPQGEPGSTYKTDKREDTFPAWPSRLPSTGCGLSARRCLSHGEGLLLHMTELPVSLACVLEILNRTHGRGDEICILLLSFIILNKANIPVSAYFTKGSQDKEHTW